MIEKDARDILVELFGRINNSSECEFPAYAGNRTLEIVDGVTDNLYFAFHGVGTSLLILFGIPANVLSVIVLSHPEMKTPMTTLLLGLTISDIILMGLYFIGSDLHLLLNKMKMFPAYYTHIRPYIFPWICPIVGAAQLSSIYFTVIITLERYIAVCHPLKARALCTRSAAIKASFCIVVVSILYHIPKSLEYETIPVLNCDNQVLWYDFGKTEFARNRDYVLYYNFWGYTVIFFMIPFVMLVYFNSVIYRVIKQEVSRRDSIISSKKLETSESSQLATMLFGIVIVFLVSYLLLFVGSVMKSCGVHIPIYLFIILPFLQGLSHSSNFIFYCAFGTRFRQRLKKTLGIKTNQDLEKQNTFSSNAPDDKIKASSKKLECEVEKKPTSGKENTVEFSYRCSRNTSDIFSLQGSNVTVDTIM